MKNKIKAVELVRQIRDAQYKQIESKSIDERIAFYRIKAKKTNFRIEKSGRKQKERIAA